MNRFNLFNVRDNEEKNVSKCEDLLQNFKIGGRLGTITGKRFISQLPISQLPMKIQTILGDDRYSLLVSQSSGNLYRLSIVEGEMAVHSFEGIYPNLQTAIDRGKSIIENLQYLQQKISKN